MNDIFETPAIRVLQLCNKNEYNMRQLLKELKQNYDKSYRIITELKNIGFIKFKNRKKENGRPNKIIAQTSLGAAYLNSHLRNQLKRTHLTEDNIRRIMRLADFTERLIKSDINPYDRLMEMNEIAFSIRSSTQNSANI